MLGITHDSVNRSLQRSVTLVVEVRNIFIKVSTLMRVSVEIILMAVWD